MRYPRCVKTETMIYHQHRDVFYRYLLGHYHECNEGSLWNTLLKRLRMENRRPRLSISCGDMFIINGITIYVCTDEGIVSINQEELFRE